MQIRIIYNSRIARLIRVRGIVLYPFICLRFSKHELACAPFCEQLLKHEFVHVEQIRREGWLRFYCKYLWYSLRYGYRRNPYELEAYRRQTEPLTDRERSFRP